jgi:hypothetical protein
VEEKMMLNKLRLDLAQIARMARIPVFICTIRLFFLFVISTSGHDKSVQHQVNHHKL